MKTLLKAALAAALLALAPAAMAKPRATVAAEANYVVLQQNARIHAFDLTARDYSVARDRSLIVRAGANRWYRATLYEPCATQLTGLSHVRFDTRPTGTLDRWAHVRVDGLRCPLRALEQIERPTRS